MLTSLSFLEEGQPWPPPSELERLKLYEKNRQLFEGKHNRRFRYLMSFLKNNQKNVLDIILNWYKRLSLLWADLLVGEAPKFTVGDIESKEQKALSLYTGSNFLNTIYEGIIDISSLGNGVFKIRYDNKVIIEGQNPSIWFPVTQVNNIKEIQYHVLAWSYKVLEGKKEQSYLQVEIHERGGIATKKYELTDTETDCKIGALIEEDFINTGIDDFLIVSVSNLTTTNRITGIDDYSDLSPLIEEMENRITRLSQIFNKHSDPNMYGPADAMDTDPNTNETSFKGGGDYFPVEAGSSPPGYVTWDGNVDGCFRELEFLMDQLYALSETCPAAFGQSKTGQAESGTSLRLRMFAPLAKVNRFKMRLDPAVKEILSIASELDRINGGGIEIPEEKISILWQDGLPSDAKEMAEIMNIRTGGKPTISQETAIKQQDNLSDADLQKELERIQMDDIQNNPLSSSVFSMGAQEQDVADNNQPE